MLFFLLGQTQKGVEWQTTPIVTSLSIRYPSKNNKKEEENQEIRLSRGLHLSFRDEASAQRLTFCSVVESVLWLLSPLITFSSRIVFHVQLGGAERCNASSPSPWRRVPSFCRWVGTAHKEGVPSTTRRKAIKLHEKKSVGFMCLIPKRAWSQKDVLEL